MQNSVAVSHTMCAYVGGPKNWGWAPPLGIGAWLIPGNTYLRSFRSNGTSIVMEIYWEKWPLASSLSIKVT